MRIAGLRSFSLIDYPGRPSAVVFTSGCNFRCPWCHNWKIAYGEESLDDNMENVKMALRGKIRERVDAICVTGGEPTIHSDLPKFVEFLKSLGYLVKVDTNGSNSDMVKDMLKLANYFAIDIKSRPEKYPLLTGIEINMWGKVEKTVKILREYKVPHELRMTYVPGLSDKKDVDFLSEFSEDGENVFLTFAKSTSKFRIDNDIPYLKVSKIKIR
ncbi:anaerobic ribonucleoside-triphosphate reductase activating protein [Mesoaciditoga lauensis]|uniref:anaerobic ribonucleoside-triphosphate reductase activating protein n=1 Tax=Mesoaciditoga lauensis TaxID=1495039 RepID=UPI00068A5FE8|nr:anaerobic ribonucleoside-triphosphate reductase activating protein [Mesoaciditoga lauensis]